MKVDEYLEQEIIESYCPMCDGESDRIGVLGNRVWYGAFDQCFAYELTLPGLVGTFDLINGEGEN